MNVGPWNHVRWEPASTHWEATAVNAQRDLVVEIKDSVKVGSNFYSGDEDEVSGFTMGVFSGCNQGM